MSTAPESPHVAVLAALAAADGAILVWQVPTELFAAFERAQAAGAIELDWDTDCYVHPDARPIYPETLTDDERSNGPDYRTKPVGWSMPTAS